MVFIPKEGTYCQQCMWSKYEHPKGAPILAQGYVCKLNPLRPVFMGIMGKHSERKDIIQESKEE